MFQIISKPYTITQEFVDNIGMYRLVSGSLGILAFASISFGFLGILPYSGLSQIFSLTLALLAALLLNWIIAVVFKIHANHESAVITALILFFLTVPEENILASWPLVAAVAIAIVSKYVFVIKKQHFLNPAAFGAATLSVTGLYTFSWWVSNPTLFVLLFGLGSLVVMKVRKWIPVLAFVGVSLIIYLAESLSFGEVLLTAVKTFFFSWPTLFLAFFMLTEPFTMPARREAQFLYGGLVGFLSNTSMFGSLISITPELALVIANVVMLPSKLTQKLILVFEEKKLIAKNTYEFTFKKSYGFVFFAGQYLEWMLPHKGSDSRGVRRYFTIASAPTESVVRVAMKITESGSSFKEVLSVLDSNQIIIASQLSGDFILPKDISTKLGFIAGGIGITPFRSHVQYMLDSGEYYNTVLYYCNNIVAEIAYAEVFGNAATKFFFEYIDVISKEPVAAPAETGYLTKHMLKRRTPDYLERTWYISGPPAMVNAYKKILKEMGVKGSNIKTDFFSGAV